jgi:tetratricopeptide (TPR) repeat protein
MSGIAPKYPNRIKAAIRVAGYKVQEITEELNIPERTMRAYLSGQRPMPRKQLEALARLVGCSVENLSGGVFESEGGQEREKTSQKDDGVEVSLVEGSQEQAAGEEETHASHPQFWYVPHLRNPFFTGREELLFHLHEVLHTQKQTVAVTQRALCGLGGIGKTQIALEYAYRYQREYQAIFWIKADTRENLLADFLALAKLLHLREQAAQERAITIAAVKRWFQSHERWLLILDNADDLALVREFLPSAQHGHTLLTTRTQALGGLAHSIQVEEMNQEVGALFLLRRAGLLPPDMSSLDVTSAHYQLARVVARELGGLPLALDQAGAYIEETSSSLREYLEVYRAHRSALLQRRGGLTTNHPEPVATTWALAFEQVEHWNPMAADLLRLCAFLDPDAIPEEILLAGIQQLAPVSDTVDLFQLHEAIGTLLRFSLVRRNGETQTLTIHRLVQVMVQQAVGKEAEHLWAVRAAQAVYQALPQASSVYSSTGYPSRAVQRLTASIILNREQENREELANELWNLAVQQQVLGKLSASEQNLQDCLALCREQHDVFNQAKAHQYFALLRTYQGDFPVASKHLDEALFLFQSINAVTEEGVVWAYRCLCALLSEDISLAQEAAKQAWEHAVRQKTDRDFIRAKWLLGWTSIQSVANNPAQRDQILVEANQHLQKALDRCRQTHTVDYEADLLLACARFHIAQGDADTALTLANEALAIACRAGFCLLQADILTALAQILLLHRSPKAEEHAKAAVEVATCEGSPYCYAPALMRAKQVLLQIQTETFGKG